MRIVWDYQEHRCRGTGDFLVTKNNQAEKYYKFICSFICLTRIDHCLFMFSSFLNSFLLLCDETNFSAMMTLFIPLTNSWVEVPPHSVSAHPADWCSESPSDLTFVCTTGNGERGTRRGGRSCCLLPAVYAFAYCPWWPATQIPTQINMWSPVAGVFCHSWIANKNKSRRSFWIQVTEFLSVTSTSAGSTHIRSVGVFLRDDDSAEPCAGAVRPSSCI